MQEDGVVDQQKPEHDAEAELHPVIARLGAPPREHRRGTAAHESEHVEADAQIRNQKPDAQKQQNPGSHLGEHGAILKFGVPFSGGGSGLASVGSKQWRHRAS